MIDQRCFVVINYPDEWNRLDDNKFGQKLFILHWYLFWQCKFMIKQTADKDNKAQALTFDAIATIFQNIFEMLQ